MILIIRTNQLFKHPPPPPFPGKTINYCIPSIRTPMFDIIISISKHLHLVELKTGVAGRLLAFNNLCGARARITKRLLVYYRCFQTSTRQLLSLRSSNGGCQTCTSLQQSLQSSNGGSQTCTSLWQSLWSSNGGWKTCNSLRQSLQGLNRVVKHEIALTVSAEVKQGFPNVLRQSLGSSNRG